MNGKWLTLGMTAVGAATVVMLRKYIGPVIIIAGVTASLGYFKGDILTVYRESAARSEAAAIRQEKAEKEQREADAKIRQEEQAAKERDRQIAAKMQEIETLKKQIELEATKKKAKKITYDDPIDPPVKKATQPPAESSRKVVTVVVPEPAPVAPVKVAAADNCEKTWSEEPSALNNLGSFYYHSDNDSQFEDRFHLTKVEFRLKYIAECKRRFEERQRRNEAALRASEKKEVSAAEVQQPAFVSRITEQARAACATVARTGSQTEYSMCLSKQITPVAETRKTSDWVVTPYATAACAAQGITANSPWDEYRKCMARNQEPVTINSAAPKDCAAVGLRKYDC